MTYSEKTIWRNDWFWGSIWQNKQFLFSLDDTWLLYLSDQLTRTKSPNVLENEKQRNMVYTCKNLWNQGSKQVAGWKVWWRPFGSSPNNRLPCAPLLSYCQYSHQLLLFQFIYWNILLCLAHHGLGCPLTANYLSPPCSASEYWVFAHITNITTQYSILVNCHFFVSLFQTSSCDGNFHKLPLDFKLLILWKLRKASAPKVLFFYF